MNEKLLITYSENLILHDCVEQIEQNAHGFVMVVDELRKPIGLLTDGDVRRALLSGASLTDKVGDYVNRNFRCVDVDASREQVLKLLDSHIRFIPVLKNGHVVAMRTLADVGYVERSEVTARAKAPARISFGGGGTDLTSFFVEYGGAVLNATINMYSHCTLTKRPDGKIRIVSHDYKTVVEAPDIDGLAYDGKLDLIKAAIKLLKPIYGFNLELASDFPPNSGLGGSSVVLAALIGAFNELRVDRLDPYAIAELAFQAERLELSNSGGWQDQYAAVFGGFNLMEFRVNRNEINSLRVPDHIRDELEERLVLCYSGRNHPKGKIHDQQKKRMMANQDVTEFAKRMRDIAYEMKFVMLRGHIDRFGTLMDESWKLKKTFSDEISDTNLDEIYSLAVSNGAIGGKLLGAGGGGYFLFLSETDKRHELIKALKKRGLEVRDFNFDNRGLRSWVVPSA